MKNVRSITKKAMFLFGLIALTVMCANVDVLAVIPQQQLRTIDGLKKCDYPGGLGLPFWDRVCPECRVVFNNYYKHGGSCN